MIKDLCLKRINLLSGTTTFILGILFIISALSFIISNRLAVTNFGWYSALQNNWLIVIFKLHAGLLYIQEDTLHGLNTLDIIILVVFSVTCLGLYINLKKSSKIWASVSFVFSLIAVILFLITQNAGRSTVMLSVIIFSLVGIKNIHFSRVTLYTGIIASVFLFTGDLTVGIHSNVITILFAIGYMLLTIWFFLISRILFRLINNK